VSRQDSNRDLQEIGAANYAVLERIRVNRREDHLKVCESAQYNSRRHDAHCSVTNDFQRLMQTVDLP